MYQTVVSDVAPGIMTMQGKVSIVESINIIFSLLLLTYLPISLCIDFITVSNLSFVSYDGVYILNNVSDTCTYK